MTIYSPIQIVELQSFAMTGTGTSGTFELDGIKAGDVLIGAELVTSGKSLPVGYNGTFQFKVVVAEDNTMQQNGGYDWATYEFLFTFLRFNQES